MTSALTEVRTAKLTGFALRYAVALADGLGDEVTVSFRDGGEVGNIWTDDHGAYWPDELWEIGGPLCDKHRVSIKHCEGGGVYAYFYHAAATAGGETALVAICRAVVASVLGGAVSVPSELLGGGA